MPPFLGATLSWPADKDKVLLLLSMALVAHGYWDMNGEDSSDDEVLVDVDR